MNSLLKLTVKSGDDGDLLPNTQGGDERKKLVDSAKFDGGIRNVYLNCEQALR